VWWWSSSLLRGSREKRSQMGIFLRAQTVVSS
jgi:hypothetical protein